MSQDHCCEGFSKDTWGEGCGGCRLIRGWDSDGRQVREQVWCEVGDKAQRYCWEIWEDGDFTQTNPITGIVNSCWFLGSSGANYV